MSNSFFGKLIKKDGKLVHYKEAERKLYENFIKEIPEGSIIEFYSEIQTNNGTLAQMAKIHAMIRDLANHTGYTFDEMKLYVKEEAGMCYTSQNKLICKSFSDCSKEELNMVIQTLEEIGRKVNFQV
mgnify:CR=1 FL=1|jgi:hypothetical protein